MYKILILIGVLVSVFCVGLIIDGIIAIYLHLSILSIIWGLAKIIMAIPAAIGILVGSFLVLSNPHKATGHFYNRLSKRQSQG
jgi:hypothetical protein